MKVDGNAKNRRIAGDWRIADPHPIAGAIGVRWVLAERLRWDYMLYRPLTPARANYIK